MPVSSTTIAVPTAAPTKVSTKVSPTITETITQTNPGQTVTVGPPKPTAAPAAVTGECPYLSADVVSDITGQHHGDTELVNFKPQPMCVFYRSDGGLMGSVRIIKAANPEQAVAAVEPARADRRITAGLPTGGVDGRVDDLGRPDDAGLQRQVGLCGVQGQRSPSSRRRTRARRSRPG